MPEMLIEGRTFERVSSSTGQTYVLEVVRANSGDRAGELYIKCPCPAGRYAFARNTACKHIKSVLQQELDGATFDHGHLSA